MGAAPQKPITRAYEKNPKAVQKWLDTEFPYLSGRANNAYAEIQWGDKKGLIINAYYDRSYSLAGKNSIIRLKANQQGVSMLSTVINRGKVRFMLYEKAMNAQKIGKFLKRLIKDTDKKVFLI